MAVKSYTLRFGQYYPEANIAGLPARSGIYCVYACTYNARDRISSLELLYIGESRNIRGRVEGHERWDEWRSKLQRGQNLCFNAALICPKSDRKRAEAAMIYALKPPCNTEYMYRFLFDRTKIQTKGANDVLSDRFIVGTSPA